MNRDSNKQSAIILAVIGILPVVWLGLLIAPSVKGGLPEILPSLLTAFNDPFHIELCGDSLKTVLVLLLLYGMGIGIYLSTRRNYRRREEHGSAKWGSAKAIDKKYRQSPPSENKLMTQNVRIGLNAKKQYFGVRRLRRRQDEILLQAELNANKQFLSGNFRSKRGNSA